MPSDNWYIIRALHTKSYQQPWRLEGVRDSIHTPQAVSLCTHAYCTLYNPGTVVCDSQTITVANRAYHGRLCRMHALASRHPRFCAS